MITSIVFRYHAGGLSTVSLAGIPKSRTAGADETIDLTGREVLYLGGDRILVWAPATGDYEIYMVAVDTEIHPAIEDYLELHPKVRSAIGFQADDTGFQGYRSLNVPEGFHAMLKGYYDAFVRGGSAEFTYRGETDPDTGNPWTGPRNPPMGPPTCIHGTDALEIYVAHVAQSLRAEIRGLVPWHLHDYEPDELRLLLHGDGMFPYLDSLQGGDAYHTIATAVGHGTPNDPSAYYRFMTGDPTGETTDMVAGTPRETVVALGRWMITHMVHGAIPATTDEMEEAYGYPGHPMIESMIARQVDGRSVYSGLGARFVSWLGCHSAGAMMVAVLRSVNIPARYVKSYLPDGCGAVDLPAERMFLIHADELYADMRIVDPETDPAELFLKDAEYDDDRDVYASEPADADQRRADYSARLYGKAIAVPAWQWVYNRMAGVLVDRLQDDGAYTESDAIDLAAQHEQALMDKWNAFQAEHGPMDYSEYFSFWMEWAGNR